MRVSFLVHRGTPKEWKSLSGLVHEVLFLLQREMSSQH